MSDAQPNWDVFISYASEDRESVAAPLCDLLQSLGVRVWFDRQELKVGDSLRERIDNGLAQSRFAVVILSKFFFAKHWPTRELNGLAQREVDGQKVILPIWHGVDAAAVRAFSPPLADRIALLWSKGLFEIAFEIVEVIRPDLAEVLRRRQKQIVSLDRVETGKELAALITETHGLQLFDNGVTTSDNSEVLATFVQTLQDWADIWPDLDAGAHVQGEFSMQESLATIRSAGWTVWGARARRKVRSGDTVSEWDIAIVATVKGNPPAVLVDKDKAFVPRAASAV